MSDYVRKKQVLYPLTEEDIQWIRNKHLDNNQELWEMEMSAIYKPFFHRSSNKPGFEFERFMDYDTDECNSYIAYTLEDDYGCDASDYGRSRDLTNLEKMKYKYIFEKILPVNEDKLRLVEYCWYNCCEPTDYYVLTPDRDPFYKPV